MGLGRASWQGTQGLPPPFRRPLRPPCDAVFAPIPTKSGASRASGWILGSWERRRPGPASAASRSLQKIVGVIVGAASRTGREHLQGSSPPEVHRGGLVWFGTRADRRGRGPPCVMQATRAPVAMAVSSPSGGLHRHEHDGCPTTIVETHHSFEDSRAVGQGREVRAELDSAVVPDD